MPPNDLLAGLPRDAKGRPIVMSAGAQFVPGVRLALAYDEKLDDPIRRYGQCLGVIASCLRRQQGLDKCADAAPPCSTDEGGTHCCPPACIAQYRSLRGAGRDADAAVNDSFVAGDCLTGLAAARAGFEVKP